MRITLDIKDSKAATFLNFIKSLDFINVLDEVPSFHKSIIRKRMDNLDKSQLNDWEDVKNDLDNKYGV